MKKIESHYSEAAELSKLWLFLWLFVADFQFSFGFRGPKFHYFSQNISELQFTFLFAWNCVLDRVLLMCIGTFSNTLLCSVWTLKKLFVKNCYVHKFLTITYLAALDWNFLFSRESKLKCYICLHVFYRLALFHYENFQGSTKNS